MNSVGKQASLLGPGNLSFDLSGSCTGPCILKNSLICTVKIWVLLLHKVTSIKENKHKPMVIIMIMIILHTVGQFGKNAKFQLNFSFYE